MAGKTVSAVVKLIDEFTGPAKKASQAAKDIEKRFQATGKKLQAVGGVFEGVGETLTKSITTPVIAAGTAAVKFADESKQAMDQFFSATGIAAKGMDGLVGNTERYREILHDIYKDDFGGSLGEVADAMAKVQQNMSYLDDSALKRVTEYAFTLSDTFGVDIAESTRAADTLIKNFGVSAREAFNLMSQGAQGGLDYSGELLDSLDEYSVQFQKLGFGADDMFNIFASGAKNGAFNLDKVGDAVKEFSLRAIDGSKTTKEGFEALGLSADEMSGRFAEGGKSAKSAFSEVLAALRGMEDPLQKDAAGVALFGTMWEDLGADVVTSLSAAGGAIDKSRESMEALVDTKYDSLSSALSSFGRTLQTDVLAPIGEKLVPYVEKGIEKLHGFADWWDSLGDAGQSSVLKIVGKLAVAGPALLVFGKTVSGIGSAVTTFGKIGGAVKDLGGAMKILGVLGKASLVGLLLGAVVMVAAAIIQNWDHIKEACGQLKEKVGETAGHIGDFFMGLGENIVGFVNGGVERLQGFGNKLIELKDGAVEGFKNGVNGALDLVQTHFPGFYDSVSGVIENTKTMFHGLNDFVTGVFTGNWEQAWDGVVQVFSGVFGGLASYAKAPLNAVIDLANSAIRRLNKISFTVPSGIPGVGGKTVGVNIPQIPNLYQGTPGWKGGLAAINEPRFGGEIVDLPKGTRVYPHDESIKKAREEGKGSRSLSLTIAKLADTIIVREEADIDKIAAAIVKKLEETDVSMA